MIVVGIVRGAVHRFEKLRIGKIYLKGGGIVTTEVLLHQVTPGLLQVVAHLLQVVLHHPHVGLQELHHLPCQLNHLLAECNEIFLQVFIRFIHLNSF